VLRNLGLVILLAFFCTRLQAFNITLSETQFNSMLQAGFPVRQQYQDFVITCSNPNTAFMGKTQSVMLKTLITAVKDGQTLRAIASVEGGVNYNKNLQQIEIIKPRLLSFNILDNSIAQSEQAIEMVKQAVGQQMPMIFLVDLQQLNQLFPGLQPKDLVITEQGLLITL